MKGPLNICNDLVYCVHHVTATYAVQDVSITAVPNGLTVKCVFAEGSTQDNCTVILVLDGVEQRRGRFSGEMTFSGLATGSYTVLVFDSEPEMERGGYDQVPALERTEEVTGVTVVTTSSSDIPSSVIGESGMMS